MDKITCFFTLIVLNSFLPTLTSSQPLTIFNLTTDQNALINFRNTITDGSVLAQNWSTNTSICYWIGVSCGPKHQRVTALNISGLELKGTIAPHLGNLTFLQSLDISSNNLTGTIPPEISKLRRLKVVNLASNHLTGSIPNGVFNNISSLVEINLRFNRLSGRVPNDICSFTSNLKRIYLRGNQIEGEIPASIHSCRELEELNLAENHFNGYIPTGIWSLPKLRILYLYSNQLQGFPADVGNVEGIEEVHINDNNLTGGIPSFIFNISSLRYLDLSSNRLSGSIPNDTLYNLPVIEGLYLSTNNLTGGIPKQFGNLTSLIQLELARNKLTGELREELGNLAYLDVLQLSYNDFLSGPIPSSIFNLSSLSVLTLQQNLFSGSLPSDMGLSILSLEELVLSYNRLTSHRNLFSGPIPNFGTLTNLQVLRLWENNLTGTGFLSSLTSCRYLENLEITDNPLNGILPTSVGNLSSSLVSIFAWGCEIQGIIPSEIGNLRSLQYLDLSENQLTGLIPATMGELNQLYSLSLGGNRLQGYIPRDLCRLSLLGRLFLYDNMLTGPIPDCIGQLESLTEVYSYSNKLNSTIPSGLWNLKGLIRLDLSVNSFGGQLSPQIGSLNSLSILDLSHNQFTGDIPISIDGCRSLQSLNLSNSNFSGSIPESLGTNIRSLGTLNLSNNRLSGLIPKSLENVRGLRYFDVSYNNLDGEIPNGGPFVNFTALSFAHNSALCAEAIFEVPTCPESRGRSRSNRIAQIMKFVVPTFVSTIILIVVILIFIRRRKRGTITPPPTDISLKTTACRRFSYIELDRGTSSFSELNLLGRGGFGSVFKATLSDGLEIAVKVFNLQLEAAIKSFDTESEILSSIRHRNLVPVIGCCANTEFRALILEYMQNGSLEKWLHSENYCLDLVQRLSIATDVALALEYLHHGHTYPVVHCDIKPSNVLLDEDMTAHVGDFGISKLFDEGETMIQTTTVATIGYAAPEYGSEGKVSTKGDVYSYGIMLLEMFTRKRPTGDMFSGEMSIKEWVRENGAIEVIVAPGLLSREDQHFSEHEQCVSSVFDLAMKCLAFLPDERIDMIQVVATLHKVKSKLIAATEVNIMPRP
ncbi:hypothetical protein CASFOL_016591 [Castilleja foliolosa]|uniref:non-specific serine/threonine protein kinase n=1 Tax=Castilleja foliolosa TaxID=1961234 RepID=A0ABD3D9Y6_9LAMI